NHDYNNVANWAGGTIDDSFNGVNFTADTVLWFSADRFTTAAGLNFNYSGNANLTLRSSSASAITLTLNEGVSGDFGGPANNKSVIIVGTSGNPVNIVLPSGTHSLAVASGDSLDLPGAISGAGCLTKTGGATLSLSNSTNSYTGATNINAGTLTVSANNVIPSTSAVSLAAGAILNVNSLSDTIGSLASTGIVASVTVSNGGSGYSSPPTVTFSGGGGSGATGTAIISGGAVTGVSITNPGSGYTSVPSVAFSAPGIGTTASGTA